MQNGFFDSTNSYDFIPSHIKQIVSKAQTKSLEERELNDLIINIIHAMHGTNQDRCNLKRLLQDKDIPDLFYMTAVIAEKLTAKEYDSFKVNGIESIASAIARAKREYISDDSFGLQCR